MSRRLPDGPAPAPIVARVRIRYAKRGRLRFTSQRDFARAFERALRHAGVPVAFSAGFSPHPKVSYLGAAPTGTASDAEYLELALQAACDPTQIRDRLGTALPAGFDILDCVEARTPDFAARLQVSRWIVALPEVRGDDLDAALQRLLDAPTALVSRLTKGGRRQIDVRGALVAARTIAANCATLDVVVTQTTPVVRPEDVVTALRETAGLATGSTGLATRIAQGPLGAGSEVTDPLAPDREAALAPHSVLAASPTQSSQAV